MSDPNLKLTLVRLLIQDRTTSIIKRRARLNVTEVQLLKREVVCVLLKSLNCQGKAYNVQAAKSPRSVQPSRTPIFVYYVGGLLPCCSSHGRYIARRGIAQGYLPAASASGGVRVPSSKHVKEPASCWVRPRPEKRKWYSQSRRGGLGESEVWGSQMDVTSLVQYR
jgi:hypothetical protein